MPASELPELLLPDERAWRSWLSDNSATSAGVWLVLHKRGGNVTTLTYDQALEEALCVGWIDGQIGRRDSESYRQRFTPRRPRSAWSARNVALVGNLVATDRMKPAGLAAVEAAQADGRWDAAYPGPAGAKIPDDLAAAIRADPHAQATFDVLTSANRYALIYRVNDAKRPSTRAKRIAQYVEMLAAGQTIHPQQTRP